MSPDAISMRRVIRALAVSVLIFLSISVPGQTTLLEAEQELLNQLLEGGEPFRFLDLETDRPGCKKGRRERSRPVLSPF